MRFLFSPYLAHHVVPLSKPPEVTGYLVEKLLIHPALVVSMIERGPPVMFQATTPKVGLDST